MVFTKLSAQDKEAFFGLLDEYFQSRPEIFGQNGATAISTTAAASVAQRVFSAANTTGASSSAPARSNNPYATSMASIDVAQAVPTLGRVAAASLAFSGGTGGSSQPSSSPSPPLPPPSFPRRALASTPGFEVDKLVTNKTSVLSAFKKPGTTAGGGGGGAMPPPAFAAPGSARNTFAPPPVRRVTSERHTGAVDAQRTHAASAVPDPEPESEYEAGEWAEVLYDYSSEDPDDLAVKAGSRVFVTAKSSEDWWTGRVEGQGKEGLLPASYVKLL